MGFLLLRGIKKTPDITMHWVKIELFESPAFSKILLHDSFWLILKFLHFNDDSDPNYDPYAEEDWYRLQKISLLLELLRKQTRKVYQPGKRLTVDKSLVLFKALVLLCFKKYIRTKHSRFGIKLCYELVTSNRIAVDILVYSGKGIFHDDMICMIQCLQHREFPLYLWRMRLSHYMIKSTLNWLNLISIEKKKRGRQRQSIKTIVLSHLFIVC